MSRRKKKDQSMKTHGLPETLWFVVSPTPNSELGDICFECDFERFALQIRGGLDERRQWSVRERHGDLEPDHRHGR